jgi:hypothetical protein
MLWVLGDRHPHGPPRTAGWPRCRNPALVRSDLGPSAVGHIVRRALAQAGDVLRAAVRLIYSATDWSELNKEDRQNSKG